MENLYFVKPDEQYLTQLQEYKDEFLAAGGSMDGCGPLRRFDDLLDYLIWKRKVEYGRFISETGYRNYSERIWD